MWGYLNNRQINVGKSIPDLNVWKNFILTNLKMSSSMLEIYAKVIQWKLKSHSLISGLLG
jgi:hypothetical protein